MARWPAVERRLALQVDCPTCGQPPGRVCKTSTGRPLHYYCADVHGRRVEAVRILRRVARALLSEGRAEG